MEEGDVEAGVGASGSEQPARHSTLRNRGAGSSALTVGDTLREQVDPQRDAEEAPRIARGGNSLDELNKQSNLLQR